VVSVGGHLFGQKGGKGGLFFRTGGNKSLVVYYFDSGGLKIPHFPPFLAKTSIGGLLVVGAAPEWNLVPHSTATAQPQQLTF
jgi:hypothetical protein